MSFQDLIIRFSHKNALWIGLAGALAGAAPGCSDGTNGADGEPGERGLSGEPGATGEPGRDGIDGEIGAPGVDGLDGLDGLDGDAGVDGRDGQDGRDGERGPMGMPGPEGPRGPGAGGAVDGTPERLALSLSGHDRLFGVTYDANGNVLATGQLASDIAATADFAMLVVRVLPSGLLDPSFGNGGLVVQNVAVGGRASENARGIVVQSDGKIVIAGTAEHDPSAAEGAALDTDLVLLRLLPSGALDTTFGTAGVTRVDLNEGLAGVNGMGQPTIGLRDDAWSLALSPGDKLVVHGSARGYEADGTTPRDDADFVLVRLTADGALDSTFSDDGVVWLDLEGPNGHGGASARAANVLPDGSIVAAGYLSSDVLGVSTQQPIIYKVDANGLFDASFATTDAWTAPGVWHDLAVEPPFRAEAYGAALQSDGSLVTMGYGPTPEVAGGTGPTDWISLRFTSGGELDASYGIDGVAYVDANDLGDNGRFVMVLPDDRILGVGLGRTDAPERDAMVAILTADGALDTSFNGTGLATYDIGGDGDHFWSAALSPDATRVAVVGIAGAEMNGLDDDDAALLFLPLP